MADASGNPSADTLPSDDVVNPPNRDEMLTTATARLAEAGALARSGDPLTAANARQWVDVWSIIVAGLSPTSRK